MAPSPRLSAGSKRRCSQVISTRRLKRSRCGRANSSAQSIDAVSQRLTALADVLAALGDGRSADAALATVSLSDLAERLHGGTPASARPADGDLILFD